MIPKKNMYKICHSDIERALGLWNNIPKKYEKTKYQWSLNYLLLVEQIKISRNPIWPPKNFSLNNPLLHNTSLWLCGTHVFQIQIQFQYAVNIGTCTSSNSTVLDFIWGCWGWRCSSLCARKVPVKRSLLHRAIIKAPFKSTKLFLCTVSCSHLKLCLPPTCVSRLLVLVLFSSPSSCYITMLNNKMIGTWTFIWNGRGGNNNMVRITNIFSMCYFSKYYSYYYCCCPSPATKTSPSESDPPICVDQWLAVHWSVIPSSTSGRLVPHHTPHRSMRRIPAHLILSLCVDWCTVS